MGSHQLFLWPFSIAFSRFTRGYQMVTINGCPWPGPRSSQAALAIRTAKSASKSSSVAVSAMITAIAKAPSAPWRPWRKALKMMAEAPWKRKRKVGPPRNHGNMWFSLTKLGDFIVFFSWFKLTKELGWLWLMGDMTKQSVGLIKQLFNEKTSSWDLSDITVAGRTVERGFIRDHSWVISVANELCWWFQSHICDSDGLSDLYDWGDLGWEINYKSGVSHIFISPRSFPYVHIYKKWWIFHMRCGQNKSRLL